MKSLLRTMLAMMMVFAIMSVVNVGFILADEIEDEIDDLNDRVDALELKSAKNKVSIFGDFRVKFDNLKFEYPAYNQYMGGDPMDPSSYVPLAASELKNDEAWSARLRLKIDAKVSNTLHFTGRLVMNNVYGGSDVPIFNGFPNTVAFGSNSTAIARDNVIRVERAAFTYDPWQVPLFFTFGRQASTNGPPREIREDRVRQGTPGALMIDAEIDGVMLGIHLDELGLPDGSNWRFCYGTGYEAGFGSGGTVRQAMVNTPQGPMVISELKDTKVAGFCFETNIPQIPGNTLLSGGYFRMLDMTDISTGYTRNFPDPTNSDPQLVTSTNNLGDMDLFGFCFQHDYEGFNWFASVAFNKSHPETGMTSLYGFGGLLGNPMESESGMAYFVGAKVPIKAANSQIGIEYNHGDKHWFSFTHAGDDYGMNKLATRGSVIEAYYIQKIEKNFDFRVGIQSFNYDYAFSGWHIAPGPMDMFDLDNTPGMAYPFPDKITNIYAILDLTF